MSPFAVVFLCIQACLVQHAYSACSSRAGLVSAPIAPLTPAPCGATLSPAALSPIAYAAPIAYGAAAVAPVAAYGGAGEGNVAVFGELPVAGETIVAGQVPVIGIVSFGGAVPAAGAVSITGNCACGCSSIY